MHYEVKKLSDNTNNTTVVTIPLAKTKMVVFSTQNGALVRFLPLNTRYIEPPKEIPNLPPLTMWHYNKFKPKEFNEPPKQLAPHVWFFEDSDFIVARAWSKYWKRGVILATNGITTEVLPSITMAFYHFSKPKTTKITPKTKIVILPWWAIKLDPVHHLAKLGKYGWHFTSQPIQPQPHRWYKITTDGTTIKEVKEVKKNG